MLQGTLVSTKEQGGSGAWDPKGGGAISIADLSVKGTKLTTGQVGRAAKRRSWEHMPRSCVRKKGGRKEGGRCQCLAKRGSCAKTKKSPEKVGAANFHGGGNAACFLGRGGGGGEKKRKAVLGKDGAESCFCRWKEGVQGLAEQGEDGTAAGPLSARKQQRTSAKGP